MSLKLDAVQYLDSIFSALPINTYINKGRCGNGGTSLELKTNRKSIIVLPLVAAIKKKVGNNDKSGLYDIEDKVKDYTIFALHGSIEKQTKEELVKYLESDHLNKNILTTPCGLKTLLYCGYPIEELHREWTMMIDECHYLVTDSFRDDRYPLFEAFWRFDKKIMITATPVYFSDRRMKNLSSVNIDIEGTVGKVTLVETAEVDQVVHHILTHPKTYPANVHVFFNSVRQVANAIRMAQLKDLSVYCRNDKNNMALLDELVPYYHEIPSKGNFSKFNFYTSKYFEGLDIEDENTTVVLVTDYNSNTYDLDIKTKGVQAVGRLRNKPNAILHITNHRADNQMKNFEDIMCEIENRGNSTVSCFNTHLQDSEQLSFTIDLDLAKSTNKYVFAPDVFKEPKTSYPLALDTLVNEEYANQHYNHIDQIENVWQNAHYDVEHYKFEFNPIPAFNRNMTTGNKIKVISETLESIEVLQGNDVFPELYAEKMRELRKSLPNDSTEWIEAYIALSPNALIKIQELDFNPTKIRKKVIELHNGKMLPIKINNLKDFLKKGSFYANEIVKEMLNYQNLILQIKTSRGDIYDNETASKIIEYIGADNVDYCRETINENGERKRGYRIL